MNKKASLKDAFVKNMEGAGNQLARDTAIQASGFAASHPHGNTVTQAAVEPSAPVILQPGSLYVQPSSNPPIQLKKKATFNLDASLHQRLKIAAAMHSREMVDIVQDALQAYLPALDRKVG
jgi:hypothetical protein